MALIYTASHKEVLAVRKQIVLNTGIPALIVQGFERSPYKSWYGYYPGNHMYIYELCRLREQGLLECIEFVIFGRDRWIQIRLNAFRLHPAPDSLNALSGLNFMHFGLPPNNRTEMRLRQDDMKGPPIFWMLFGQDHKLGRYLTRKGFEERVAQLTRLIERDMKTIDAFLHRWHKLHTPNDVDWNGHPCQETQQ